ncbi:MAG TPA: ATP-binding protein [Opitutaceae bacterium]|nr:ATP-binding protein [Opitutaceae bacterium]
MIIPHAADAGAAATAGQLRARYPSLRIILYVGTTPAEENILYLAGSDLVLRPPLSREAVDSILGRQAPEPFRPAAYRHTPAAPPPPPPAPAPAMEWRQPAPTLGILRDLSRVLGCSIDDRQFPQSFLAKLREILGVNRAALFVESPDMQPWRGASVSSPRLSCIASVGIPKAIIDCFELSRSHGIGEHVARTGQIVRHPFEAPATHRHDDPRMIREMDILGGRIAVPVHDRERCIGAVVLGGKLTGDAFSASELEMVFHLMEELGLALRNSWLHGQVAASQRLFSDMLTGMTSGTLVVGADLNLLHANRACVEFLGSPGTGGAPNRFEDLPRALRDSLHELIEKGVESAPFEMALPSKPGGVFRFTLVPFPNDGKLPQPAMAIIEDFTQVEAAKRAEIEAANLKLTALMARRFAHEIRNSLVPLTTHQQLFDSEYGNDDFRQSLKHALEVETGRIQRFTEQMLYLSHTQPSPAEIIPLEPLLRESFNAARTLVSPDGTLEIDSAIDDPLVKVHRPSLFHAFKEIFLNSLQSGGRTPSVAVHIANADPQSGEHSLVVSLRDSGAGFNSETVERALEPFCTKRNTGVGLGLTVARKIITDHGGHLEVRLRARPDDPDVVIRFPQDF